MSREHPLVPKGEACRLDLSPEYQEGIVFGLLKNDKNPYDFFNDYLKYYAWDMGYQVGKRGMEG